MQALYKIAVAKSPIVAAVEEMREHSELSADQAEYAERLVRSVREQQSELDGRLSKLIRDYDYSRIVLVDKIVMRIAAYELLQEPAIPPAVSIDEAIEIVRKFSTPDSSRFVNGVLDQLRLDSPKANWDPAMAPPEFAEEPEPDEPIEVEEETIQADSDEAKKLSRIGGWKLRTDDR